MSSGDPQASETHSPSTPADVSENTAPQSVTPDPPTDKGPDETQQPPSAAPAEPSGSESAKANVARGAGPLAARGLGVAKPASPAAAPRRESSGGAAGKKRDGGQGKGSAKPMGPSLGPFRPQGKSGAVGPGKPQNIAAEAAADEENPPQRSASTDAGGHARRVAVPSLRQPLADDLQAELDSQLAAADVTAILGGSAGMENRQGELEENQRVRGRVLKMDADNVYVALGGPDEGTVSRLQFETEPQVGESLELIVRGFTREDGLYSLVVPGQALDVGDWEDLDEGSIVEAHVTAANTGGLEVTVGNIRGFIPISQIAQYRVEDATEFVGQRLMCVVTECNPRRKNLVLSRRSVLEREREEQRQQQLEKIEVGDTLEGTVRSVKDFGAFVDLGGLDGLIHVTRLSWDHVKHPSDVLQVGQKVKVKIEKLDKQTGKIGLSYRDLLENPWDTVDATLAVGTVTTGEVTRLANFGAFVRLGPGIEGLVHISEIAGHRVSQVNSVLKEGEQVTVKVLSIERESQKIALSIKQAQSKAADAQTQKVEEVDETPRELVVKRQHSGPLKGGVGKDSGGNQFGLKW